MKQTEDNLLMNAENMKMTKTLMEAVSGLPEFIDSMTLKLFGSVGTKLVAVSDKIDKVDKRKS